MIHIRNLQDLSIIKDDPELYREIASHILYCRFEMLEDEDDIDDHDFSISVFRESDTPPMNDLGPPEEVAIIRIECCGEVRIFHRNTHISHRNHLPRKIPSVASQNNPKIVPKPLQKPTHSQPISTTSLQL